MGMASPLVNFRQSRIPLLSVFPRRGGTSCSSISLPKPETPTQAVKPSVNPEMLKDLVQWNNEYGSYKVSAAVE